MPEARIRRAQQQALLDARPGLTEQNPDVPPPAACLIALSSLSIIKKARPINKLNS